MATWNRETLFKDLILKERCRPELYTLDAIYNGKKIYEAYIIKCKTCETCRVIRKSHINKAKKIYESIR